MTIIVSESNGKIEVVNGHRRLEAQLQLTGEATVNLDGKAFIVIKNEKGQLVEKTL